MIIVIVTAIAIIGLAIIILGTHTACRDCPYKHICDDLQTHGTPNLCEQNDILQNK